jgi:hypothetical protein
MENTEITSIEVVQSNIQEVHDDLFIYLKSHRAKSDQDVYWIEAAFEKVKGILKFMGKMK